MHTSHILFLLLLDIVSPVIHALPLKARNSGPGIILINASKQQQTYYFFNNIWNGDGTAGPNFNDPTNPTTLAAGKQTFISLDKTFKGRVQRGTTLPATWVEFQISASNDNAAHGDVSLEQGCDGAATIESTDGTNVTGGFTNDVLSGVPAAALQPGTKFIASTMGNWNFQPNQAAIAYLNEVVGQSKAYITGGTGVPDIASTNNVLKVTFY